MHLELLYRLQEIDRRKQALDDQLAALPAVAEITAMQEQLASIRGEMAAKKSELVQLEKERKRCELDASDAAAKQKEMGGRLYGGTISNLKELEKLEKMIGEYRKQEAEAEDRELSLLLQADGLQAAVNSLSAKANELQALLSVKENEYATAADTLRAEMAGLPPLRAAILSQLDERTIGQYEALREKKKGLVIVPVRKQTCGGCRIGLSMGTMQELRNPNRLVLCENCGRILFWQGE